MCGPKFSRHVMQMLRLNETNDRLLAESAGIVIAVEHCETFVKEQT